MNNILLEEFLNIMQQLQALNESCIEYLNYKDNVIRNLKHGSSYTFSNLKLMKVLNVDFHLSNNRGNSIITNALSNSNLPFDALNFLISIMRPEDLVKEYNIDSIGVKLPINIYIEAKIDYYNHSFYKFKKLDKYYELYDLLQIKLNNAIPFDSLTQPEDLIKQVVALNALDRYLTHKEYTNY